VFAKLLIEKYYFDELNSLATEGISILLDRVGNQGELLSRAEV